MVADKSVIDRASRVIGDKVLCGLRERNKVKFFVYDTVIASGVETLAVRDVTHIVAGAIGRKLTSSGWISVRAGYCPVMFLSDEYNTAVGRKLNYITL